MNRWMRRCLVAVTISWLLGTAGVPTFAQSAEDFVASRHVMIRQRLEPDGPIFVGQPVRLWVEVMTRTWFLQAPGFPTALEVRNAIVIPPESFAVNSTERIGGETYAVQGRSYTVFPQTTGRFEVPSIAVILVVARDDASPSPEITLQTEPLTIEARLPAGAEGYGVVLSTPALEVHESYSRSMEGLRVGDSFERRVTMSIEDSVAMLLPPIPFEANDGVAVYPDRPDVSDQRNRGRLSGTRVESASYVMQAQGAYRLPEVTIRWWNLRTSSLERVVLPAVSFTVEANPDLAAEHLGGMEDEEALSEIPTVERSAGWGWREWILVGFAALLGALAVRWAASWMGKRDSRRRGQGPSESDLFRRFEEVAGTDDRAAAYQALLRWLDHFESVGTPATVRGFVASVGDEELTRRVSALEASLFGKNRGESADGGDGWQGRALAAAVGRARTQLLRPERLSSLSAKALPPLNLRSTPPGSTH